MTAWSQEAKADTFIKTLRESLAEFDRRLLAVEKAVSRKPIIEAGDKVFAVHGFGDSDGGTLLLAGNVYEVRGVSRHGATVTELLIGVRWFPADSFMFHSRPDREHHEATAQNDDFLAPPLPWWARSPKVG